MRRRKVVLTIEAETVLTTKELRQIERLVFTYDRLKPVTLEVDPKAEAECGPCRGTITQIQVNVIRK